MPRPRKFRRVCCMPISEHFGPLNMEKATLEMVQMSVDEYEAIRLMDLEGYTQEQCAQQMGIARSTVQGIYNDARKKLAESLVHGKMLTIGGGDYMLCENFETEHKCNCQNQCHKRRCEL